MPLPRKGKKEKRSEFVSRCVSKLAKRGEGDSTEQRVAICNSQFERSKGEEVIDELKQADNINKLISEAENG